MELLDLLLNKIEENDIKRLNIVTKKSGQIKLGLVRKNIFIVHVDVNNM